jgi:CDP-diacylglycerol--inositol 3-phosphatidyltransferase
MTSVWFYIPNIIGYIRIVTGLASFCFALDVSTFKIGAGLYMFSYWLDALDGVAARRYNQCEFALNLVRVPLPHTAI